jgi:hypothetical protein
MSTVLNSDVLQDDVAVTAACAIHRVLWGQ